MKKRKFRYQYGAFLMFLFFGGLFLLLYWRFVSIQATGVVKGHELATEALSKYESGYALSADRGKILDRNENIIAEDTLSYRLVAVISEKATEKERERDAFNQSVPNNRVRIIPTRLASIP
mgnify:CR=1 FL=1